MLSSVFVPGILEIGLLGLRRDLNMILRVSVSKSSAGVECIPRRRISWETCEQSGVNLAEHI